jgi:hypothetical protein
MLTRAPTATRMIAGENLSASILLMKHEYNECQVHHYFERAENLAHHMVIASLVNDSVRCDHYRRYDHPQ